jgi:hypothetical protein
MSQLPAPRPPAVWKDPINDPALAVLSLWQLAGGGEG